MTQTGASKKDKHKNKTNNCRTFGQAKATLIERFRGGGWGCGWDGGGEGVNPRFRDKSLFKTRWKHAFDANLVTYGVVCTDGTALRTGDVLDSDEEARPIANMPWIPNWWTRSPPASASEVQCSVRHHLRGKRLAVENE